LSSAASPTQRFGPDDRYELQPLQRQLLVDGKPAALGARAFDLLLALAAQPGALRSKHELIEAVWPDVVVEEGNLATQISALRKVLGGEIIATIPGRGYRFATAVSDGTAPATTAAAATTATTAAPPGAPAAETAAPLRTNLPGALPPLIGRAAELAALGELVDDHRLVTLLGAGGMGKTRLAQALLHGRRDAYAHGVCWVDLSAVGDAQAIPTTIAAALGLDIGRGEPLAALRGLVKPLALLVALDNAEHLLEATAAVAQALLDAAPALRLLVTSQAPLKLPLEYVYRLESLAVPQRPLPAAQALAFGAVALFAERARQADNRFVFDDGNAGDVIELCRQLDGLALAIELAAARAPMLGVHLLATSMADRLKLLGASRGRPAPARQQTLRATLEWSHGLLDQTERTVFRRLAVFAGSGSLSMVRRVVADDQLDEWTVLDALALLVERSLVVAMAVDATDEPRYRLLETPRLFALEQLQAAGEEDELRRRHALACAARFDRAWDERWVEHTSLDRLLQRLDPDLDNAAQAWAWACAADDRVTALRLASGWLVALTQVSRRSGAAVAQRCRPWLDEIDDDDLFARTVEGIAAAIEGIAAAVEDVDRQMTVDLLRRALARWPAGATAPPRRRWMRQRLLGRLVSGLAASGALQEAKAALDELRRIDGADASPYGRLSIASAAAILAAEQGELDTAIAQMQLAIADVESVGGDWQMSMVTLVDLQLAAGDAAAAAQTGTRLLARLSGSRKRLVTALAQANLAAAWLAQDEVARARTPLQDGWAQAPALNLGGVYADYLALLAALESRPRAAALLAGWADTANAAWGPRQGNEAAAIDRARRLARAALGDAEFDRLHAAGAARLREGDVAALAFAGDDAQA